MPAIHRSSLCIGALTTAGLLTLALAGRAADPQPKTEPLAPEKISLWNGNAPVGDGQFEKGDAWITVHRPAKSAGAAIVICPGGGYGGLVTGPEGHGIATWLNSQGITGVVLEYRLPRGRHQVPLSDAQRAIRTVRARAKTWDLDPSRIGIMGFSAGGHLASTAGTHFDAGDAAAAEAIDRASCRPDFMILVYPVITMGELTHAGSKKNLLGDSPTPALVEKFSNETQVTKQTPPAFLAHAVDDKPVPPGHSRAFYDALRAHDVAARYLELPSGGHGLNGYKGPMWDAWQTQSLGWLAELKFIPKVAADWPQWMGPNRDDVWYETGILDEFPASGPKFVWRKPVHGGFAGPAVADGKVYVTDYVKSAGDDKPAPTKRNDLQGKERILCFDARTGSELWKHEYDCAYTISYPAGPRCTPTVDDGLLFTLGAMGDLLCLDAKSGGVLWSKNLPRTYGAAVPLWGYAGHPLVYKNSLICTAGGQGSAVVAFDKKTGQELWKALATPEIGYSPPTLIHAGGVTQLLIFHGESLNSLNPETGEVYWSEPLRTSFAMAIMAPRKDGDFLFAGGHSGQSLGLKLDTAKPAVTRVWEGSRTTGLAPVSGTPFVENGIAYGIDGNGIFRAMRIATGERLWGTSKPVNGQDSDRRGANEGATFVTKNGNRFFIFGENGDLVIARLSPEKYDELSRTKLLDPVGTGLGRPVVWSHPAYAQRCVFARNDQELVCVSLAAP